MSNLEEHMDEQDRITAACEAGVCGHPECHEDEDEGDGGAATVKLIADLREMLRVYVSGEAHNETRGQALSTIRDATRWLNTHD